MAGSDNKTIRGAAFDIVESTRRKIRDGTNGDIQENLLILASANFVDIQELKQNPIVKLGMFMKEFPALAYPFVLGSFLTLMIGSLLLVVGVLDKLGLAIVPIP